MMGFAALNLSYEVLSSDSDFLKNVDFERGGEHRPPSLQERLHPNVAGDALPVELPAFVGFVFDFLNELGGVVDVLQEADLGIAEHMVVVGWAERSEAHAECSGNKTIRRGHGAPRLYPPYACYPSYFGAPRFIHFGRKIRPADQPNEPWRRRVDQFPDIVPRMAAGREFLTADD
jgi:hypothetical protein